MGEAEPPRERDHLPGCLGQLREGSLDALRGLLRLRVAARSGTRGVAREEPLETRGRCGSHLAPRVTPIREVVAPSLPDLVERCRVQPAREARLPAVLERWKVLEHLPADRLRDVGTGFLRAQ